MFQAFYKTSHSGSVLLMMLIIFSMMIVVLGAGIVFVNRQLGEESRQESEEKLFEVAESGVRYALFVLNDGAYDPIELVNNDVVFRRYVTDPVSGRSSGVFVTVFPELVAGQEQGSGVRVMSLGLSSRVPDRCQAVVSTIELVDESEFRQYRITQWDHQSTCDPQLDDGGVLGAVSE